MKFFGGLIDRMMPKAASQSADGGRSLSIRDPLFLEAIRTAVGGGKTDVMHNGAINRAVRLHCEVIGMLPLNLLEGNDQNAKAVDHPVYRVLHDAPNNWQTPLEFKRLMQWSLLEKGAAYAQIVRSSGRVIQLQPLHKFKVEPKQNADWSISYALTNSNGSKYTLAQNEVLAIRDLDITDGFGGSSRIRQARDAIELSSTIKLAAKKLFDNGMHVGGAISSKEPKGKEARAAIKADMIEKTGADRAGTWLLLDGFEAHPFEQTLGDNLQIDNLKFMIEEVGRIFGVPRPLLMMDDTSWGSGIEALAQFFVTYGMAPQFVNWEQAIQRDLLTESERRQYSAKFNERALLRGSMKDQAEVFAKALGSGGHRPWMAVDEVRGLSDLPPKGFNDLPEPSGVKTGDRNVAS